MNDIKVSLKDKLRFRKAKSIDRNPQLIESILGERIILTELSGAWQEEGIFVKGIEGYSFLSRRYSDPSKNGRGNMILARAVDTQNRLAKIGDRTYFIDIQYSGGASVYDESDLVRDFEDDFFDLRESYKKCDVALSLAGIHPVQQE